MSWKLGAGLGFLRGGPLGALIGGTLQHFVTKKYFKKQAPSLPGLVHRGLFVSCLAAVLTKVMMARGPL
nr:hypothetical protein [Nitrospinaceae bacterium]NIR55849.1 hypothetical protein [Nitrospinaceae bacterium]NIS86302.1 hypothetical protein [Nitrospinaceae bacterium]NIT81227.1 hypothetical protein [Nitrospinaceae bacterium]NIU45341.1 hypothetical protein [Nitrospinaceae bacterium]